MKKKADITRRAIKKGIAETSWPGRIEYIRRNPDIILDGAHNPDAAEKFISYLEKKYPDKKICAIIGMMADKDQKKTLLPFSEICSEIIFTSSKTTRAEKPENLAKIVKNCPIPVSVIPELEKAIIHAVEKCPADTVIIITGSLYVAGEAKAFFEKTTAQTAPN